MPLNKISHQLAILYVQRNTPMVDSYNQLKQKKKLRCCQLKRLSPCLLAVWLAICLLRSDIARRIDARFVFTKKYLIPFTAHFDELFGCPLMCRACLLGSIKGTVLILREYLDGSSVIAAVQSSSNRHRIERREQCSLSDGSSTVDFQSLNATNKSPGAIIYGWCAGYKPGMFQALINSVPSLRIHD